MKYGIYAEITDVRLSQWLTVDGLFRRMDVVETADVSEVHNTYIFRVGP
jgi:hypothetical protein